MRFYYHFCLCVCSCWWRSGVAGSSDLGYLVGGSQKDVRPLCLSLCHTLSYICSYRQAQAAVLAVLPRLHQLKVPTKRPTDYFAEMAKSDQQMQKVRNGKGFLWKTEALYFSLYSWLVSLNVQTNKGITTLIGSQLSEENYYLSYLCQIHANQHQLDKCKVDFFLIKTVKGGR